MITLKDFSERIKAPAAEPFLLICGEAIVFDRAAQITYVPITTYGNAAMNPMTDFRTTLGHGLLWSQHVEVDCSSAELCEALSDMRAEQTAGTPAYAVYKLLPAA